MNSQQSRHKVATVLEDFNSISHLFNNKTNEQEQKPNLKEQQSTNYVNNQSVKGQKLYFLKSIPINPRLNVRNKCKFIHKNIDSKQKLQLRKGMNKVIKRRINHNHQKIDIFKKKDNRSISLIKIYDWMMEAAYLLGLFKNTFYTAVKIILTLYNQNTIPDKSWQTYICATLSIVGKIENATIPFIDRISKMTQNNISKQQISKFQIQILKKINFKIPILTDYYERSLKICQKWRQYLSKNEDLLGNSIEKLRIDNNSREECKKYMDFMYLSDYLLLNNSAKYLSSDEFQNAFQICLYIVLAINIGQQIPVQVSNKTYFSLIYQKFLREEFSMSLFQILSWKSEMIRFCYSQKGLNQLSKVPLSLQNCSPNNDKSFQLYMKID